METKTTGICDLFRRGDHAALLVLIKEATLEDSTILSFLQFTSMYCVQYGKGDVALAQRILETLDQVVYRPFKGTVTLTFGDVAESHVGMEKIGDMDEHGFSLEDLQRAQGYFNHLGAETKLIYLNEFLPGEEAITDLKEKEHLANAADAYLLVVRNGVELLIQSPKGKDLLTEMLLYQWDSKLWNARKKVVQNKIARHNLNFSQESQEADFAEGKGTTVAFGDVPMLNKFRNKLIKAFGEPAKKLKCEGNLYYARDKTGIGYHGDTERRKVIGVRLGHKMNIHFMWYYNNLPRGLNMSLMLEAGDIYCMSEKTVGTDWRPNVAMGFKNKSYVLRHAAGASKYTKQSQKLRLTNAQESENDPEIVVASIENRKKGKNWQKMPL